MIMITVHTDHVDPKPDILHGCSHNDVRAANPVKLKHIVLRFRFSLICGGYHIEKPAVKQNDHQWVFGKV